MKLVFVSSTFKDMQFERDRLHSHVVPQIDETLSAFGESVYFGDLRWGVNTSGMDSEESSQKVLSVCLDEIDGCKPYMIVLIGERYGWIPEEVLIKETATLKGIDVPSDISVTQLEIEYGALLNPDLEGRVVFYFRELDTTGMTESELKDYKGESALHTQKIELLKDRIKATYPNQIRTYTAKWDAKTKSVVGLDGLMSQIQQDLQKIFLKDIATENSIPWQQRAMNAASRHYLEQAKNYYPIVRMPDGDVGSGSYSAEHHHLSIISGSIGSGKSAFIANKYYRYTLHPNYSDKTRLVPFVFNLDSFSSNHENLIKLILFQCEEVLGFEHLSVTSEESLTDEHIQRVLQLEKQLGDKSLAIFVDNATDQVMGVLSRLYQCYDNWQPNYPFVDPYVNKYYVAYNESERGCLSYPMFDYAKRYTTRSLAQEERMDFIQAIIKGKHKELSTVVCEHIIQKTYSASPFYIKLIVERLLMLDSNDFKAIRQMGDGMDAINAYMISIVDNVADNIEGIVQELASEAAQRIDQNFVCRLLAILSCSEDFLQEDEIKEIFAHQDWEYSQLNMSLTTKTLGGFLTIRTSERKYRIVNPTIAKYLREFTWQQGYRDTARIMANFAKAQPQETMWYRRAFGISIFTEDSVFAAEVFNEIYLAEHLTKYHQTIQNTLCKDVCDLLKKTIMVDGRDQADKTKFSQRLIPIVAEIIYNIVTFRTSINYTPILKYIYTQLTGAAQNTSITLVLIKLIQLFEQKCDVTESHSWASFYEYINCIVVRIAHKTMMESAYFLQKAQKIKKGFYKVHNYRMLTDFKMDLCYLERGIYADGEEYLSRTSKDLSKYFYLDEQVENSVEKDYINTVQKGHCYHVFYQLYEYGEESDYDLIDKAIECYESIDWNNKTILKFLTIDDVAEIIETYVACIHSYNPSKSASKIKKLKDKIPFYLQKAREVFETDLLDSMVPKILVSERWPQRMTEKRVEQLSDLYLRAINRQYVADNYLHELYFDDMTHLLASYLRLFEEYNDFPELHTQTQCLTYLISHVLSKPSENEMSTIDKVSMTMTKHFDDIIVLLERLELNEDFVSIEILLADFYNWVINATKPSPLCTQIIVMYLVHRYLPFDEDADYGDDYYEIIYRPKEQSKQELAELLHLYDTTNGGDVRIIAIASAETEMRYYQSIINYIRDNVFGEE